MEQRERDALLAQLSKDEDVELAALDQLKLCFKERLPDELLSYYRLSKDANARLACVYYSLPFAKKSKAAFDLGVLALTDRSKEVRFRACMLLALSQKKEAIPDLRQASDKVNDAETKGNIFAAIDAILSNNQNYFVDRDHTGQVFLEYED